MTRDPRFYLAAGLLWLGLAASACGLDEEDELSAAQAAVKPVPDPAASTVTIAPASAPADGAAAVMVTVVARDSSGAPVAGWQANLSATGPGNIIIQPGKTDASGHAFGQLRSTEPGPKTIEARLSKGAALVVINTHPTATFTPVLMSIQVIPDGVSLSVGGTFSYTAIGTYSDGSTADLTAVAVWSSSNLAVASVSNTAGSQGRASALGPGTALITAQVGPVSDATLLTVTAVTLLSIQVVPDGVSLAVGAVQPYTAIGNYSDGHSADVTALAIWTSSDPAVAVVSNSAGSQGLASALAPGNALITAQIGPVSDATLLTVHP